MALISSLMPFNKYDWSTSPLIDCDTDAEMFVVLPLDMVS